MSKSLSRLLATMTCAASLSVYAADQEPPHDRHKPPQVALDACKGQAEKATCQFSGRDNETINGTCVTPRNSDVDAALVCRPGRKDKELKDGNHGDASSR